MEDRRPGQRAELPTDSTLHMHQDARARVWDLCGPGVPSLRTSNLGQSWQSAPHTKGMTARPQSEVPKLGLQEGLEALGLSAPMALLSL